ncbi:MAG: transcription initiation factor IIB family protein [Nanoarchaeota archaeon]
MIKCPECGGYNIREMGSETICPDCGLVIEDTPLQQEFISDQVRKQAEHAVLNAAGSRTPDGKVFKAAWLLTTREKNIRSGLARIDLAANGLKLPDFVTRESKVIYKRAMEADLAVGRNNMAIALASVYAACNLCNLPKTALEVSAFTEVSKEQLLRAYKLIKLGLGLKSNQVDPADLIMRFASRLGLRHDTIMAATEILEKIKNTKISQGRKPETILAAALYIASKLTKDQRTQREIANALGVIEITIRKRSREIKQECALS